MAAVLACGPAAVLSHQSAAELWGMTHRSRRVTKTSVTVPPDQAPSPSGVLVHRRSLSDDDLTTREGIPTTTPPMTLIDLATGLSPARLEAAINEADKLGLVNAADLPSLVAGFSGRPGVKRLRSLVDRHAFRLTDSELERRFLRLIRAARLPDPETGAHIAGFKVDFVWADQRVVVETDGLRFHRTPASQARDRKRDQALTAAGFTPLRFTHAQIRYEPTHVEHTLRLVLGGAVGPSPRAG